jgi:hypothetical protein
MENMIKRGQGTLAYRDGWNLFDQIIISHLFLDNNLLPTNSIKPGFLIRIISSPRTGNSRGIPTAVMTMGDTPAGTVTIFRFIYF